LEKLGDDFDGVAGIATGSQKLIDVGDIAGGSNQRERPIIFQIHLGQTDRGQQPVADALTTQWARGVENRFGQTDELEAATSGSSNGNGRNTTLDFPPAQWHA
jgi:hypothetical protein